MRNAARGVLARSEPDQSKFEFFAGKTNQRDQKAGNLV